MVTDTMQHQHDFKIDMGKICNQELSVLALTLVTKEAAVAVILYAKG